MSWAACRRPTRREVLAGTVLMALAGCLPGLDDAARPKVDPELGTRARIAGEVRGLAGHYEAVMDRFPATRARLATLAAEHEAHARALLGPAPSPATPSAPAPQVVPATEAAAVASLADAERAGSRRRSRQARRASPVLARLLASVAACEAAHAALLSSPAAPS